MHVIIRNRSQAMHTLRILFAATFICTVSTLLPAQIIPGLKGGINLATMAQENGPDIQSTIAATGGLTFDLVQGGVRATSPAVGIKGWVYSWGSV